jgi:hypothetical protein
MAHCVFWGECVVHSVCCKWLVEERGAVGVWVVVVVDVRGVEWVSVAVVEGGGERGDDGAEVVEGWPLLRGR